MIARAHPQAHRSTVRVLPPDRDIVLAGDPAIGAEAKLRLGRVGYDTVVGQLDGLASVLTVRPELTEASSRLTIGQLAELKGLEPELQLVDVRNPGETEQGTLPGAREIPLAMLTRSLDGLDRSAPVVVYCASGYRSQPNARFYVRNHFETPRLDPKSWRLEVTGLVDRPLRLSLRDLRNMPSQALVATLECAGNGRSAFDPPVEGEQWHLGAVSTAEWTGVPLIEILDRAGVAPEAVEIVFRGADQGTAGGCADPVRFERSLPVADATSAEPLLAYAMNGEPLPLEHGYPLRLIVPGWYAVASVKWLIGIEVVGSPFQGFFQAQRYVYETERNGTIVREPVRLQQVRSVITQPSAGQDVTTGDLVIRGVAWSGAAPIGTVEVSIGGGPWQEARLIGQPRQHSWQWWELLTRIDHPGETTLRARATDRAGRTQPDRPHWNRLGYAGNAVQSVPLLVR